jgi:hypothetical protein
MLTLPAPAGWRSTGGANADWIFGLGFVNRFVLASPDHISQVDLQWRPLFGTTAVLLVITEALGIGLAVRHCV